MTIQASKEVIQLLFRIFAWWEFWPHHKDYYLKVHLPRLKKKPELGTSIEKKFLHQLKEVATAYEWQELEYIASEIELDPQNFKYISTALDSMLSEGDLFSAEMLVKKIVPKWDDRKIRFLLEKKAKPLREIFIEKTIDQIQNACALYNFDLAEELNSKLDTADAKRTSKKLISSAKLKQKKELQKIFVESTKQEINNCLQIYDFKRADFLYSEIETDYPQDEYSNLVQRHRKKREKEEFIQRLSLTLSSGELLHAEALYLASNLITYEEFLDIKAAIISEIIQSKYSQKVNTEQSYALAEISSNTLVKARAGSGKTRIIVTKVALLLDFMDVELNKLIVLAFNKKAAQEINERMENFYKRPGFKNAITFHSLAYKIVDKKLDIISDLPEESKDITQTQFVQNALRKVLQDKHQLDNAYQFLRAEIDELKKQGLLLDEEEYYLFQRGSSQFSLHGEKVFSELEKIIADYLFEHEVDYQYSKGFKIEQGYFRTSFFLTINDQMLIIETWENFGSRLDSEERYSRDEIRQKFLSMCEKESITLLEITKEEVTELSRLEIESILGEKLRKNEVVLYKLPIELLYQKVFDNTNVITRLASLCTQFIKRAKKLSVLPEDLIQKISSYTPIDGRESAFLELAELVYKRYEKEKEEAGKIDFDDLLLKAINKVITSKGNCVITVGKSTIHLNELRWIFIDEFQDFSELFYRLLLEIVKINNELKFFCVGDDWQAINGFAGSDLKFFFDFDSHIDNSKMMELVTNHRSQAKIVHLGNKLMNRFGTGGEPLSENQSGYIKLFAIEDIKLFSVQDMENAKFSSERSFYLYKRDNGHKTCQISTSKYLKLVHAIVTSPEFIGKSIAILSRTNELYGVSNSKFINHLNKWLSSSDQEAIQNQTNFVEISTIHSYKGREADVVILLEVTNSKFPLIHPDNYLLNILGRTINDSLDEERRLFYVGITRAKSALFLLTEKSQVSPFVKNDLELEFNDPNLNFPDLRVQKSNLPDYLENWDDDIPF